MRRRVAILISGRGSNMAALVAATRDPAYPAGVALVLSNRADAPGLLAARAAGVPARCIAHVDFPGDREGHEAALIAAIEAAGADLVCLAGYLRRLTPLFVGRFAGRLLNVHPSLLPLFPGLDTHRRAIEAGVRLHGCTVHRVTETVDAGPILAQAAVPVLPGDTTERLAARVLAQEHRIYPAVLAAVASGGWGMFASPDAVLCNPLPLTGPIA